MQDILEVQHIYYLLFTLFIFLAVTQNIRWDQNQES